MKKFSVHDILPKSSATIRADYIDKILENYNEKNRIFKEREDIQAQLPQKFADQFGQIDKIFEQEPIVVKYFNSESSFLELFDELQTTFPDIKEFRSYNYRQAGFTSNVLFGTYYFTARVIPETGKSRLLKELLDNLA